MSQTETPVKAIFARHQTFHPRFGWLKKGFDLASEDKNIFTQPDAAVCLGVGKNMVNSIRYWCIAFKLLSAEISPTEFGKKLLGDRGWDCFLENPASLWLLHWYLLKPVCYATAWHFMFNIFSQIEFTTEELFLALQDYKNTTKTNTVDSSLKKDITCILRMYLEDDKTNLIEDSIDSPFKELGIIHQIPETKRYRFSIGSKPNLPAEVVVAACLEYAASQKTNTIAISRLIYDIGSPGLVFKLSESAIYDAIEQVEKNCPSIRLSDSAGLIQFSFTKEPNLLANDILNKYYRIYE